MAPTRTRNSTRAARIEALDQVQSQRKRHTAPRGTRVMPDLIEVDGLMHGWLYKKYYAGSDGPEFNRPPDPRVVRPVDPRPPPLSLQDLECVKTLGEGEFGKVLLVRTQRKAYLLDQPGTLFAMKVIKKKHVRQEDQDEEPLKKDAERSRLVELPWNPFVNGIMQTFYDDRNLYLLLELIPCGCFRAAIAKHGPFDTATAAFYYANIVCGLAFLEEYGVVHRDIKPDNILMGPDGYLCLADFGSAALEFEESDWMLVGTPAYIAPECISPQGQTGSYGKSVDWWASGCILHEMLTGKMTFYDHTEQSTYRKVQAANPQWPPKIRVGKTLKSLILALLTVDAAKRLGTQSAKEVMDHPWLRNVEWTKMSSRQYLAPYVPRAPHLTETWHDFPLPEQRKVPNLRVVKPPVHLSHDDMFPVKVV